MVQFMCPSQTQICPIPALVKPPQISNIPRQNLTVGTRHCGLSGLRPSIRWPGDEKNVKMNSLEKTNLFQSSTIQTPAWLFSASGSLHDFNPARRSLLRIILSVGHIMASCVVGWQSKAPMIIPDGARVVLAEDGSDPMLTVFLCQVN